MDRFFYFLKEKGKIHRVINDIVNYLNDRSALYSAWGGFVRENGRYRGPRGSWTNSNFLVR